MLQKALGCLFVFGIAPVGIGGLWTKGIGQKREKILNLYLAGFLSELAVFQLIAVPVMVKEVYGMNLLVYLTTAVFAVLAATGFIWTLLRERDLRKRTGRNEDVNQQQAVFRWLCKASDFSDAGFHYADLGEYFDLYE